MPKRKKKCSRVTHFSDHLRESTVGTSVLMCTCVWVCEWPESTNPNSGDLAHQGCVIVGGYPLLDTLGDPPWSGLCLSCPTRPLA